jgi:hypothetical protein
MGWEDDCGTAPTRAAIGATISKLSENRFRSLASCSRARGGRAERLRPLAHVGAGRRERRAASAGRRFDDPVAKFDD